MTVFDLLIIYKDGTEKVVKGVSDYGTCNDNSEIFRFEKNGYRGFIPKQEVRYLGREFDYKN